MNYSNFSCRLSTPRLVVAGRPENPAKASPKKARKASGRRRSLVVTVAETVVLLLLAMGGIASANEDRPMLRVVPAAGIVAFAEGAERPTEMDDELIWIEESEEAVPFSAHVEAFKTQVSQATQPTPARLSVLTAILLGGGVAVALFRVHVFFQPGAAC